MSVTLSPRILELLCSRLCHDLISPVGAINNGVELIEEIGEEAYEDAIDLIGGSGKKAGVHLKCFRLAYGAAGSGSDIRPDDIKTLLSDWMDLTRADFEWNPSPLLASVLPPGGFFKCLLNAGLFMSDFLGQGGTLSLEAGETEPYSFTLTAKAEKLTRVEDVTTILESEPQEADLTPQSIQGYMFRLFCDAYGVTWSYDKEEESKIVLKVVAPA